MGEDSNPPSYSHQVQTPTWRSTSTTLRKIL